MNFNRFATELGCRALPISSRKLSRFCCSSGVQPASFTPAQQLSRAVGIRHGFESYVLTEQTASDEHRPAQHDQRNGHSDATCAGLAHIYILNTS